MMTLMMNYKRYPDGAPEVTMLFTFVVLR